MARVKVSGSRIVISAASGAVTVVRDVAVGSDVPFHRRRHQRRQRRDTTAEAPAPKKTPAPIESDAEWTQWALEHLDELF